MTVYFIKPIGMDTPIKIGCSANPDSRKAQLETWSPFALEIIAQIPGDEIVERRFHALFRHSHERREWFTATPDLLATIAEINRGTFDVSTLPPSMRLVSMVNGKPRVRSEIAKQQTNLTRTANRAMQKSGYSCPINCQWLVHRDDALGISIVNAFASNPERYGIPIDHDWAVRRRALVAELNAKIAELAPERKAA